MKRHSWYFRRPKALAWLTVMIMSIATVLVHAPSASAASWSTGNGSYAINVSGDRITGTDNNTGVAGVRVAAYPGSYDINSTVRPGVSGTVYATTDSNGTARFDGLTNSAGYWFEVVDTPQGWTNSNPITVGTYNSSSVKSVYNRVHTKAHPTSGIFTQTQGNLADSNDLYYMPSESLTIQRENPTATLEKCEDVTNIAVMADLSYSTNDQFLSGISGLRIPGGNYQNSLNKMVDSMSGKKINLTIDTFSGHSPAAKDPAFLQPVTYRDPSPVFDMSQASGTTAAKDLIKGLYATSLPDNWNKGTNWDAAFEDLATRRVNADAVLFITDGMPTVSRKETSDIGRSKIRNINHAINASNTLKAKGIPVVALAVGDAIKNTQTTNNIKAISGPQEGKDFYRSNWDNFSATIDDIYADLCDSDLPQEPEYVNLGGKVWHDQDRDGIQDSGEPATDPYEKVIIREGSATGNIVGEVTPAADGSWTFEGEAGKHYFVEYPQNITINSGSPTSETETHATGSTPLNDSDGRVIDAGVLPSNATDEQKAQLARLDFGVFAPAAPAIEVIKKINGDDANATPGVKVAPGSDMNVTFEVTNTGNVPLTDVKLADDVVPADSITPASGFNGTLAPGQSTTYTATIKAPATGSATHKNTATTSGQPPVNTDGTTPARVTDNDPAHAYTSSTPAISVIKKINGDDANATPGVKVAPGSDMNITFEVTNTGDTVLNNVKLTDDVVAAESIKAPAGFNGTLAPGQKVVYTATVKAPATGSATHKNTATVTGTPPNTPGSDTPPAPVKDDDPANAYTSSAPGISVIKKINGDDANTAPGVKVAPGSDMNVTFEVTNTGDTVLNNVKLTDDVVSAESIKAPNGFNGTLAPGAKVTFTATVKAPATGSATHKNTATVVGTPPNTPGSDTPPAPVKDDDPANAYTSASPAIQVIKKINGDDANATPGVKVAPGSNMNVTFEVTNTGDTTLNNVKLSDDVIAASDITTPAGFNGTLEPGQKVVYTATIKAPETGSATHKNTATVTGTPPDTPGTNTPPTPVEDDDPANAYTSASPNISVIKKINGDDANAVPGVKVAPGANMNVTFDVTNTGDTTLNNVKLSDDVIAVSDITTPAGFNGTLTPGQRVTFTATIKAPATGSVQHKNTATVTGVPPVTPGTNTPPAPVTDDDPAHAYTSSAPSIQVIKKINGQDANTAPGVTVDMNSDMNITFEVTNTGDTTLNNVKLSDDVIGDADITTPAGFNGTLAPGQKVVYTATYKAPQSAYEQHKNTATVTGVPPVTPGTNTPPTPVEDDDPAYAYTDADPSISVIKKINGQDANTAPGVKVNKGANMNVTFEVTNTGNVRLTDVKLSDDVIDDADITTPAGFDGTLAPGAKVTFTATHKSPAAANTQHKNTATVVGTPPPAPGSETPSQPVTDDDPAHAYTDSTPGIQVIKKINGEDANSTPGVKVDKSDSMNVTFEVTNTGDVTLRNVTLKDNVVDADDITPAAGFDGTLAPGETTIYTATIKAPSTPNTAHKNTATVTGTPPNVPGNNTPPAPVEDDDPAHAYTDSDPAIEVVKKINGDDANTAPGVRVDKGSDMDVTFEVTNTGDVTLRNVKLSDDVIGDADITTPAGFDGTLAPGETVVYKATYKAPSDAQKTHRNVGTVTGTAPQVPGSDIPARTVDDSDPAHAYTPGKADINVVKKINGQDANTAPGVKVDKDSDMNVTFEVTNTGDTRLTDVKLSDDVIGDADIKAPEGFDGTLDAGETVEFTATYKAPSGGYETHKNTATVTGQPDADPGQDTPGTVTDDDPAHAYTDADPSIQVIKKINGDDANDAPGVRVEKDSSMDITFEVTNTGDVKLTDVKLSDDVIGDADIKAPEGFDGTLDAGETVEFTATYKAPQSGDYHKNTATVVGTPPNAPDTDTPPTPVRDDDDAYAHVDEEEPQTPTTTPETSTNPTTPPTTPQTTPQTTPSEPSRTTKDTPEPKRTMTKMPSQKKTPAPKLEGPEVNTGGHVEQKNFWERVLEVF